MMKKLYSVFNLFVFFFAFSVVTHASDGMKKKATLNDGDYIPNTVIIKIKSAARSLCSASSIDEPKLKEAFVRIGATAVTKMFSHAQVPAIDRNKMGKKYVDLSLIYEIHYSANVTIDEAIHFIQSTGVVEYAEPKYIQHTYFTPNDPYVSSQYFLGKINAYNAWNVWQGDTNTVIGIVDSGTDWDHPDLVNSIKYNYNDPIDGSDNDGDGYIDNFHGWDVSNNDNDPTVGVSTHGSHVSGCAAATTNNGIGVASPTIKCKFLPVKSTLDDSSSITHPYEGVTYAAEHGCSVINCSWGQTVAPSQFEQDVINYAAINYDVVVVAAAGNGVNGAAGTEINNWPASYDHVVSVAATGPSDAKAGFSDFSFKVDVSAPGSNIWSTIYNNTYDSLSGTSMSSPIAASCVAMIRSRFPSLNAEQAAMQLRNTCDNIYTVPGNSLYNYKLGKGRVNLYNAISNDTVQGVLVSDLQITDGNDDIFVINDTLNIGSLFSNMLRRIDNLTVTLSTTSTYVTILNNSFNIDSLRTLDTISNYLLPFRVRINPTAPANSQVSFRMTLSSGSYSDFYSFKVFVNEDYQNIAVNDVATSITSIGRIGYNSAGPGQGLGFTYKGGESILYEAGLLMGTSGTQVSDAIRAATNVFDKNFQSVQIVRKVNPGISAFDTYGVIRDNGATATTPMNVLVQHRAYAWTSAPNRNYVIVGYTIKNTAAPPLNNFFVGIFADWDILPNPVKNRSTTDMTRRMGYSYSTDVGGYYAGVKLLSHTGGFNHYAFDNDGTGTGGMNLYDGFTKSEKYTSLSTTRTDAGVAGMGNDVSDVVSTGPFTITSGDSVVVAFALIAADNLDTLLAGADASQLMYDSITLIGIHEISLAQPFGMIQNFPNPSGNQSTISFTLPESNFTELSVYNALGEKVKTLLKEKLSFGTYSLPVDVSSLENGTYFYRLTSGLYSKSLPAIVVH